MRASVRRRSSTCTTRRSARRCATGRRCWSTTPSVPAGDRAAPRSPMLCWCMGTTLDAIAKSIRLVRLGDEDFADKNKKVVWHRGDEGFDLVTHVDDQGLVV